MSRRTLILVGVALIVVVAFLPSLHSAPVWDDADLTVRNRFLASFDGVLQLFSADMWTTSAKEEPSSFYRPIAMASYALNRAAFGNSPASYHAGNIALHAGNAVLVALLAQRLGGMRLLPAVLAALGFALAPLNTETVTWLAGRFDLLGVTCLLGALLVNTRDDDGRFLAVPLLLLALLSKEAFVTGVVLLIGADVVLLGRSPRAEAAKWALFAACVGLMFLLRRTVGVMSVAAFAATPPSLLVGSLAFLLLTFGRELVWPSYLDPFRHFVAPTAVATVAVLALAFSAFAASVVAARRAPGDRRRLLIATGVAWAFLTLGPVAVTGPNLEMVGDRYAYLPLVGAFLALGALLDLAIDRAPQIASLAVPAIATAVLLAAAIRDRGRLAEWKDERTLFTASVRDDPENFYSVYSLGQLNAVEGKLADAEPLLLRADALRPGYWRTENALCFVWLNQDRLPQAERACLASAEHNPENPRVWINLTSVYVRAKIWTRCLDVVDQAVARRKNGAEPLYLRAVCRANTRDFTGANADLRGALAREPGHPGAKDLLAQLRAQGLTK